ncbi:MAG: TIGR02206 family membrane protein [Tissierellia bacterium]|nr:TIGR02206 family membrane protein [Tissierellia bacterium]
MSYFFRGIEDGYKLPLFGKVHITLLFVWLIGMILISVFSEKIRLKFKNNLFLKLLVGILLVDQIVLYAWQFGSGFFRFDISLPLYHCRISVFLMIIGVFFDKKWAKSVGLYWGILGTVMAMILPDLYKFSYPHYTNFQFFIVHILLGYVSMYIIAVEMYNFPKKDLKFVLIFTNIFNISVTAFNLIFLKTNPEINYGYLIAPPKMLESVMNLNMWMYILLIFVLYNLIICLLYFLGRGLYRIASKGE